MTTRMVIGNITASNATEITQTVLCTRYGAVMPLHCIIIKYLNCIKSCVLTLQCGRSSGKHTVEHFKSAGAFGLASS